MLRWEAETAVEHQGRLNPSKLQARRRWGWGGRDCCTGVTGCVERIVATAEWREGSAPRGLLALAEGWM